MRVAADAIPLGGINDRIEVDTSLPGLRVQQVLERLKEMRGLPASITVDNGPEFAGKVLDAWAYEAGVTLWVS